MAKKGLFGIFRKNKKKSDSDNQELLKKRDFEAEEKEAEAKAKKKAAHKKETAKQTKQNQSDTSSATTSSKKMVEDNKAAGNAKDTPEPKNSKKADGDEKQSIYGMADIDVSKDGTMKIHDQRGTDATTKPLEQDQKESANDNVEDTKEQPSPKKDVSLEESGVDYENSGKSKDFQAPSVLTRPIIVSFLFNGNKIANDFIFTGHYGKKMTIEDLPSLKGYRLADNQRVNYSINQETQRITLNVVEEIVTYEIIPVNQKGEIISVDYNSQHQGRLEDTVPAKYMPHIPGYEARLRRHYVVETGNVKVTYIPKEQQVTVLFVTTEGEKLDEVTLRGLTGTHYRIDPEDYSFKGYELAELPDELSGTFSAADTTLELKYEPVDTSIIVSFLDETATDLHRHLTFSGKYGHTYNLKKMGLPIIDGYDLDTDPNRLMGTYQEDNQQIVLRYKRAQQSFKIHYWFDKKEQKSANEDLTVSGLTGDFYKVIPPKMDGYEPSPEVIAGKFDAFQNNDVDVVYSPIKAQLRVGFEDEAGRVIDSVEPISLEGVYGENYKVDLPHIPGYTRPKEILTGKYHQRQETVVVYYRPVDSKVRVEFMDARTQKPINGQTPVTLTGPVGTAYNIDPKMIEGYSLSEIPEQASGIFKSDEQIIKLFYQPNRSKIIVECRDKANNELMEPISLEGYYGQKYSIRKSFLDKLKGYTLENADKKLSGHFPVNQQTIKLYLKAKPVEFTLVAVDQFKKPIDHKYDIHISGLPGQKFSHGLPKIPGYSSRAKNVGSTIKTEMDNTNIKIGYVPNPANVSFHFVCVGGPHDQANPFPDYDLPGRVGDTYDYDVPPVTGYKAENAKYSGKYRPETQYIDVKYNVIQENYVIEFIGKNEETIDRTPLSKGQYGQIININSAIPTGYHLPVGSDKSVTLSGKSTYQVQVVPDTILVEIVAEKQNGESLNYQRQISGEYHQPQTIQAPLIPGYKPVKGDEVKVNFELNQKTVMIKYVPEERQLTVRFIDTQGNSLRVPKVIAGHFDENYKIEAPKIKNYFTVGEDVKTGRFGMKDAETAFIYRAGSDELNQAITPLEDLLVDDQSHEEEADESQPSPQMAVASDQEDITTNDEKETEAKSETTAASPTPAKAEDEKQEEGAKSVVIEGQESGVGTQDEVSAAASEKVTGEEKDTDPAVNTTENAQEASSSDFTVTNDEIHVSTEKTETEAPTANKLQEDQKHTEDDSSDDDNHSSGAGAAGLVITED